MTYIQSNALTPSASLPKYYDLVTIGSGTAARAAANEARRAGKTVAMIEHGIAGGTCLNVGCVPSKFLLAAAAGRASAGQSRFPGIHTSAGTVDLAQLIDDKDRFIRFLRERDHIKGPVDAGIDVLRGSAAFAKATSEDFVELDIVAEDGNTARVQADHVLIASGAAPYIPEIPGLAEVEYLTSSSAMALEHVPESLLVIGGNAIGLEQAQLFARLGSKVKVLELAPRIAPFEEPAISAALERALSDEGIAFHTAADITGVQACPHGVFAKVVSGGETRQLFAEKLLIATGRRPATAGLKLDAVNVSTGSRGEILVDDYLRTSNPRIWAAGDVTGMAQFVYVAGAQGATAANNAFGRELRALDYAAVPRVTFTSPELASVGITAAQADAAQIAYEVRELPMSHVVRAIVSRHTDGLLRLISDSKTGKILGVHIVGEAAGEIIAAATYALSAGFTVEQLATTWSPSFTMAESLKNVAKSAALSPL